ncbi:MAG: DUF1697 domain-containing protein [Gemmatimonadales bacterium]
MTWVALLRGINVGGNRAVSMKTLKEVFEDAGMDGVRTYINSGNVVFSTTRRSPARIAPLLEEAIEARFGFAVDVLVVSEARLREVVAAIPATWTNDQATRCDVLFLWDDVDRRGILDELPVRQGIDTVRYAPGAVIWRIDRKNIGKSRMAKLVGTALYKRMTIRNCNTARKLLALMES